MGQISQFFENLIIMPTAIKQKRNMSCLPDGNHSQNVMKNWTFRKLLSLKSHQVGKQLKTVSWTVRLTILYPISHLIKC